MSLAKLKKETKKYASLKRKKANEWFFKTGKGEYGEGDKFIGISMPEIRMVAKNYLHLSLKDVEKLLHSKIHEYRMTALVIWTYQFEKADDKVKEKIYKIYLKNTKWINNWDLVDVTTPNIIGKWLLNKDRKILYKLAKSKNLWEKRISIIATFTFIREEDFKDTLKIAEILLNDEHDLIHKAVGWMLREVGKRDQKVEEKFLKKHYKKMPRTMLRYAIEKFSEGLRQSYLKGRI